MTLFYATCYKLIFIVFSHHFMRSVSAIRDFAIIKAFLSDVSDIRGFFAGCFKKIKSDFLSFPSLSLYLGYEMSGCVLGFSEIIS